MISILLGIILGLSMAAPPGPVNAIILNESVKSKIHGSSVGLGAMTADLIFYFISYNFRNFIPKDFLKVIYIAGGLLLIIISTLIIKSKFNTNTSPKGNYLTGLSMGLTNPYQITWWLTIGIFMLENLGISSILGFFIGILIWVIIFPLISHKYIRKYSKYTKIASFIIILAFGFYILLEGIKLVI
ncbi:LysE family transporter [Acidianus brierleyi]|nr:LysE family transporter [Acidianus brierleyi]